MRGIVMKKRTLSWSFCFICSTFMSLWALNQGGTGKGRLFGSVSDQEGRPIADVVITLRFSRAVDQRGGELLSGHISKSDAALFETKSDQKGRWAYSGLATGIWEVTATARGFYPATFEVTIFQLQKNTPILFKLEKKVELPKGDSGEADLLEKANDLFAQNKFAEALPLYRKCLEINPKLAMVAFSFGACLQGLGDFDAALTHYESLAAKLSKDPLNAYLTAQAYTEIAACWWKKGDADKARAFFRRALETKEGDELWAFNWGEICFAQGVIDEAIEAYGIAIRLAPSWSDPEYKIALAYLNKKDREKAVAHFSRFLVLEPGTLRSAEVRKALAAMDRK
jgi:lipopolysaccharide biosynthesis regulator YciM